MIYSGDAADVYDRHHRFFHALDGEELVGTVEVEAAGEDVGAGESAEGELGAVGAATYGADCGGRASLGDGLAGFPQLAPSDVPCGQLHFPP